MDDVVGYHCGWVGKSILDHGRIEGMCARIPYVYVKYRYYLVYNLLSSDLYWYDMCIGPCCECHLICITSITYRIV